MGASCSKRKLSSVGNFSLPRVSMEDGSDSRGNRNPLEKPVADSYPGASMSSLYRSNNVNHNDDGNKNNNNNMRDSGVPTSSVPRCDSLRSEVEEIPLFDGKKKRPTSDSINNQKNKNNRKTGSVPGAHDLHIPRVKSPSPSFSSGSLRGGSAVGDNAGATATTDADAGGGGSGFNLADNAHGSMLRTKSLSHSSGCDNTSPAGLATFGNYKDTNEANDKALCCVCQTTAAEYVCEDCEKDTMRVCDECRFDQETLAKLHDEAHHRFKYAVPDVMPSSACSESSVMTSSLFFNPCTVCGKTLSDTEAVFRCEDCDYILCEPCYLKQQSQQYKSLSSLIREVEEQQNQNDDNKKEEGGADSHAPRPSSSSSSSRSPASSEDGGRSRKGSAASAVGVRDHTHTLKRFQRRQSRRDFNGVHSRGKSAEGNRVINEYVVCGFLGKGSYADVKLVQRKDDTRALFAVKVLRKPRPSKSLSKLPRVAEEDTLREIVVMKFIDHVNVVRLYEVIDDVDDSLLFLIMEYCQKGPVHVWGQPALSLGKVRKYGRDILRALLYLHSEFLYHRDVKPANCLVTADGVAKLADFGACSSRIYSCSVEGTPAFSCPEHILGEEATGEVVDSWAFAVTLFQMYFADLPSSGLSNYEFRQFMRSKSPIPLPKLNRDDGEGGRVFRDLLSQMLKKNLSERLLLRDAARHRFFSDDSVHFPSLPGDEPFTTTSANDKYGSFALPGSDDGGGKNRGVKPSLTELVSRPVSELVVAGSQVTKSFHSYGLGGGQTEIAKIVEGAVKKAIAQSRGEGGDEDDKAVGGGSGGGGNGEIEEKKQQQHQHGQPQFLVVPVPQLANKRAAGSKNRMRRPSSTSPSATASPERGEFNVCCWQGKMSDLATASTINSGIESHRGLLLSNNYASSVSSLNFHSFQNLRHIWITHNRLRAFPKEVLAAPRLQHLDLSHNNITDVPPALVDAVYLESLHLHSNCISKVGLLPDKQRSVLVGRSLRMVNLTCNPLQHLPDALHTVRPGLELVVDCSPHLAQELREMSEGYMNRKGGAMPALVTLDSAFPKLVADSYSPIWLTKSSPYLFRGHTLKSCGARHVILGVADNEDSCFPSGLVSSSDMKKHIRKYNEGSSSPSSPVAAAGGSGARAMRRRKSNTSANLHWPRIFDEESLQYVHSYFFVTYSSNDKDDENNRQQSALVNYVHENVKKREPLLVFVPIHHEEIRNVIIAALSIKVDIVSGDDTLLADQQAKYEKYVKSVFSAMKNLHDT